jgi:hypothetical protein
MCIIQDLRKSYEHCDPMSVKGRAVASGMILDTTFDPSSKNNPLSQTGFDAGALSYYIFR